MRTNPKNGSVTPGVPRRGTARSKPQSGPQVKQESAAASKAALSDNTGLQDEIAKLAYALWQARGENGGSPEEDWLRAEQEILARSKV